MTPDLMYLALTAGLCLVSWIPYIAAGAVANGLPTPDEYRNPELQKGLTGWLTRAKRAHANLVENLPIFTALVLVAHVSGQASETTATACALFFWLRVAYALIYIIGVPYLRTLVFALGTFAQLYILFEILA